MSKRAFVTGGSGFIGSHLIPALQRAGWDVTCYDLKRTMLCRWIAGDVCDSASLRWAMQHHDMVFHLAALADVRSALKMPLEQIKQNFLSTQCVLEIMREVGITRLAFASTAVVYGDAAQAYMSHGAMAENRLPQATSIYGAMKFASESLITAYCHGYGMTADILRLVSVVGTGYQHGNLLDFYLKVKADPTRVEIFGDPYQMKYYIGADDVADAFCRVSAETHAGAEVWNVSHNEPNTIMDSLLAVNKVTRTHPDFVSAGPTWTGDLPALRLDTTRLRSLGWGSQPIYDQMLDTVYDFVRRGL